MAQFELRYYGGNGYTNIPEIGHFIIRFNEQEKKFYSLEKAREFYNGLVCDKALWTHTPTTELLECHTLEILTI